MASPNDSFHASPALEAGRAQGSVDEKASGPDNSPTLTASSTFKSSVSNSSAMSHLKRAQTWATSAGKTILPSVRKGSFEIEVEELESHPVGYPKLACFLDSDDSFTMYRRFGILHARLLLEKQDILRELEEELFTADAQDLLTPGGQKCLRSREAEDCRKAPPRGCRMKCKIMADIQENLLEYGQILKQAQDLNAMNKPPHRDHRSVVNFLKKHPIVKGERDVYYRDDLVSLRSGRENAWLDAAVEAVLRWYPCKPLKKIFCTKEDQKRTSDPLMHYFSRSRINFVVTLIITLVILILLVAPIVGLFELTQRHNLQTTDAVCIGILLVSTLVFSSVLSMFTKAKRHEVLAAAAGYCAVLVVFVGNIGNANSVSNG